MRLADLENQSLYTQIPDIGLIFSAGFFGRPRKVDCVMACTCQPGVLTIELNKVDNVRGRRIRSGSLIGGLVDGLIDSLIDGLMGTLVVARKPG